jgi:hypothetical protein
VDIPLAFCILTLFNEYDIDFLYANVVIVPFPYFYMCNYMHLSFIFVSILGTYHICSVFIPINVKATSLNSLKINKKSPNNEYSVTFNLITCLIDGFPLKMNSQSIAFLLNEKMNIHIGS